MSSGLLAPPRWRAQVSLINLRRAVRLTARLHSFGAPNKPARPCIAVETWTRDRGAGPAPAQSVDLVVRKLSAREGQLR